MEINQISLTPNISIPKGNFDFLIEATHNERLYASCLSAEKHLMTDYDACLTEIRTAIELLGIELEKWYRAELYDLTEKEAQRTIFIDLKRAKEHKGSRKERRRISKKNFYVRHVIDFEKKEHEAYTRQQIKQFVEDYHSIYPYSIGEGQKYENKTLKAVAYDLYARCSEPIHVPGSGTKEDSANLLRLFRQLLCLINYVQEPYDIELTPMNDYYPIPYEYYDELNLIKGNNVKMYVSEDGEQYYMLKRKDINYMDVLEPEKYRMQVQELDTLDTIWNRFLNSTGNIVYVKEDIGTPDYRRQIFGFVGRPQAMTQEYIDSIDKKSKREELVRGLIRSVKIMHETEPPVIHRWLNPECIYVCEDRHGLMPFIVKFETIKPSAPRSEYAGRDTLDAYFNSINLQKFVAPEVRNNLVPEGYDGKSADIYSLGKLIKFIYGRDETLVRDYIEKLISKEPLKRPNIATAASYFNNEVIAFEPTVYDGTAVLTEFRLLIFTRYYGFDNYLIDESVAIGRMANRAHGDIKVDSPIASRSHGAFIKRDTGFEYMDMNSTNGTFINGVLYGAERSGRTDRHQLHVGDIIRIDHPEFKKPHRNAVLMFVLHPSRQEMMTKSIELVNGMDIYIGREYGDIRLMNNRVSKRHARFVMKNEMLYIQDFDSKNGVYVNGERICGSTRLYPMDSVRIEDYIFIMTEKRLYYYAE